MKKAITQKHYCGCGFACMAFVLDEDYHQIVDRFSDRKAELQGLLAKEIIDTLRAYGLKYSFRHFKSFGSTDVIPNNSIVLLKFTKTYPVGHYLVKHNSTWMDPWINFDTEKYIKYAESGYRDRLPYNPSYVLYPLR
jgi:hypothetical protein